MLTGATGVDSPNSLLVGRLLDQRPEDALGHGRPADVAEADEQNTRLLEHLGSLQLWCLTEKLTKNRI